MILFTPFQCSVTFGQKTLETLQNINKKSKATAVYLNSPYIGHISIGTIKESAILKGVLHELINPLYNCIDDTCCKNVSYSYISSSISFSTLLPYLCI